MANAEGRFSRHLPGPKPAAKPHRLIPDANWSRNVSVHVIQTPSGEHLWTGKYLLDLLEVVAECHPDGLLVDVDGLEYLLTVAPAPKGVYNG